MRNLAVAALLAACTSHPAPACEKEPIKIAVVDTGFGYNAASLSAKLCLTGHRDFTNIKAYNPNFYTTDKVPRDDHGHGTNVVGVIRNAIGTRSDYCFVIIKYYNPSASGEENLQATISAFKYLIELKPDITNYSAGGNQYDENEKKAVQAYLDTGATFVTAAGNDNLDLELHPYFPAMYDKRVVVVGNAGHLKIDLDEAYLYSKNRLTRVRGEQFYRLPSPTSNFGFSVTRWEVGENIWGFGIQLTGTSQATAVATGKIVRQMKRDCVNEK